MQSSLQVRFWGRSQKWKTVFGHPAESCAASLLTAELSHPSEGVPSLPSDYLQAKQAPKAQVKRVIVNALLSY